MDDTGLYFKLGRVSPATAERWDALRQSFVIDETDDTRTTDVLLDLKLQVGGIVGNANIARTTKALLRRLEAILESSSQTRARGYGFVVTELQDPMEFLARLQEAYAITKFTFTAHRPNFVDAEEFTRALEEWGDTMGGRHVQASVSGDDLNERSVERQTRKALAGGGEVVAQIRATSGSRMRTIRPGYNPIVVEESSDTNEGKNVAIDEIRERYRRLREEGSDDE